jgi:hypothetical protein
MGQKTFRPGNAAAMVFLNATNPQTIKVMRTAMVDVGFKVHRLANDLLKRVARKQTAQPPSTLGKAPVKEQVIHFINKKMPGGLPRKPHAHCWTLKTETTCPSFATRRPPRLRRKRCFIFLVVDLSVCSARSVWPHRPCYGMRVFKRPV